MYLANLVRSYLRTLHVARYGDRLAHAAARRRLGRIFDAMIRGMFRSHRWTPADWRSYWLLRHWDRTGWP